jgi:hypothetical protein
MPQFAPPSAPVAACLQGVNKCLFFSILYGVPTQLVWTYPPPMSPAPPAPTYSLRETIQATFVRPSRVSEAPNFFKMNVYVTGLFT